MPYYEDKYSIVHNILTDSGIGLHQLGRGQYDKLIQVVGNGEFDISFKKGADGKYMVVGGKALTTTATNNSPAASECPDWMPENLCAGYNAISRFAAAKNAFKFNLPNYALESVFGDEDEKQDLISKYAGRVGVIITGIVLVAVGVIFMLKDSVTESVISAVRE